VLGPIGHLQSEPRSSVSQSFASRASRSAPFRFAGTAFRGLTRRLDPGASLGRAHGRWSLDDRVSLCATARIVATGRLRFGRAHPGPMNVNLFRTRPARLDQELRLLGPSLGCVNFPAHRSETSRRQ